MSNEKEKRFLGGVGLAVIIAAGLICVAKCTVRVPAGYVAVEYKMNGGISKDTLSQGWNLISPTVKTSLYSIGIEQSYLTSEDKGDSPKDESFKTPTADGKQLLVDLEFSYKFDQDQVADVFTRFKGQSGESVKNTFIKPKMKAWTQEVTAKYPVTDVFGDKRQELNEALDKYLKKKFEPYGITISNVSLINIDVDKDTMKAINAKIKAQQDAETQAIQNQTNIDKAKADAEAEVTKAKGDADAKVIAAQAEADANAKINSSITDQLIRMKEAEARLKHGWVTVQGSDTVVTKDADSDQ